MEVDPFWTTIAIKAATIDERLSGKYAPVMTDVPNASDHVGPSNDQVQENLKNWCDYATNGDRDLFARRLARDGLNEDDVAPFMGDLCLADGEELPEWVETARWIFERIVAGDNAKAETCPPDISQKVPFADFFWPVVVGARHRTKRDTSRNLRPDAQSDLDRILILRMAQVYELTLFESFTSYRQAVGVLGTEITGSAHYEAFKSALRNGPFANLIAARPVMIRLLAVIVDQWIATSSAFVNRLEADIAGLVREFPELQDGGKVQAITGGISDPHNHGKMVLILRFENGEKIVYKPRPITAEAAWRGLSDWFDQASDDIRLGAAKVWPRGDYGWMRFVKQQTSLSYDQAPGFYRAAGQLLAIMYCLKGSDMHHENILLADGRPVVIDLETLFQPELRLLHGAATALHAQELAQHQLDGGVFAVGLLPRSKQEGGFWIDDGGLACAKPQTVRVPKFRSLNHDDMVREWVEEEKSLSGLPITIAGEPADIALYADDVLAGFSDTIRFLDANKAAYLAKGGPVDGFSDVSIRHVMRPTAYYQELERAAYIPQNQENGFVWSLNFERLCRHSRWDLETYSGWVVHRAERAAMTRLDVPLFVGKADQDGVWADGLLLTADLTKPAVLPTIADRIENLSQRLAQDLSIIRQAILANVPADLPPRRPWPDLVVPDDLPKRVRQAALAIATDLADQAIISGDSATWLIADVAGHGKGLEVSVMGDGLYGGTAGVALFFASCHAVDGASRWRDMSFAALAAPRHAAREGGGDALRTIGGFDGLGGFVYVLTRCAKLLDAPELLDEAVSVSAYIDGNAIASGGTLDVISGVAGAILALLALYDATGNQAVLDRAIQCGRHLPDDPANWKAENMPALAGMSHGAAGTICALFKLYHASGEKAFFVAAQKGLDFERGLFDPAMNGWPDLRSGAANPDPIQWCHGAAGVGLARMATLHIFDNASVRAEIEIAIASVMSVPDGGRDNICCGHAGRLSMLAYARRLGLGPKNLDNVLLSRIAAWLRRVEASVGPNASDRAVGLMARDKTLQTGLMQGLAGIGQVLLEIAAPDQVPPVLVLE